MEVEMDASGVNHHHHLHHHQQQQELSSQTLESMLVCTKAQQDNKKPRPAEHGLKCPRCDSINTKFCYYNNYSLTQPRYFCKSCRRYWTKGGTLRNVPVGGGCRKNKRSSSTSSSATSSTSTSSSALSKIRGTHEHLLNHHHHHNQPLSSGSGNPNLLSGLTHLPYDSTCTDLSLAFARLQSQANGHLGFDRLDQFDQNDHLLPNSSNTATAHGDHLGFIDAIRGRFLGNAPNGYHNMFGNGEMGSVENGGILMGSDQDQEIMNPMFHNQQHLINNSGATTAVTMAAMKQETCHELGENNRGSGGILWGIPWQMGAGGGGDQGMNAIHEVESGRSQIAGWNGLGSTAWHGLINSPLM
ncbi:hypothetical protein LXL04_021076 [Taraxacum kok-saghyz]